jgi:hypothetical protein
VPAFVPVGIPPDGPFFSVRLGPDFCGIWDKKSGQVVARFDFDQAGWERACAEARTLGRKRQIARIRGFNPWIVANVLMAIMVVPALMFITLAILLAATGNRAVQMNGTSAGPVIFLAGVIGYTVLVYVRPTKLGLIAGPLVLVIGFASASTAALDNKQYSPSPYVLSRPAEPATSSEQRGEPSPPQATFQPPTGPSTAISGNGFKMTLPAGWRAMGKPTSGMPYFAVLDQANCAGTALILFKWPPGDAHTTSGAAGLANSLIGGGAIPGKVLSNEPVALPAGPARYVVSVRVENGRPVKYAEVVIPAPNFSYQLEFAGWAPGCPSAQPLEIARTFRLIP